MDLIEKIFKPMLTLAAFGWLVLAATHTLDNNQLLIYMGILSILMGIRNLLILNVSAKTNHYHEKIQNYVDRYGQKNGLIRYGVMLVGAYLVLGVILITVSL